MSDITVNELENLVEECFKQRAVYEEIKDIASEHYNKLEEMQAKIGNVLENLGMTEYKAKAGSVSYKWEESFRVPKDGEARAKFFDYLKQREVFDTMISVNSKTLNAFAKAENEAAIAKGDIDFQIPGIEKAPPAMRVTMRKAK